MIQALSLQQIAKVVDDHPRHFAVLARQPTITVDMVAHAVSCMAVDPDVAASLIAASTGILREDVKPGFLTLMQASFISAMTLRAHPHDQIAAVFYDALVPGFTAAVGTVQ